jgi:cytochrome c
MTTPLRRSPIARAAAWLAALLGVAAALPWQGAAQTVDAPSLYSAAQAEEGKKVFEAACVSCHGLDLAGKDDAPPIAGAYFASSWGGHKVSELIEFVQGNMPFTSPGSLDEESYLRVVAYVLSRNGVPAGDTPLAKGAAGVIAVPKN